ncbi:hypothetical protein D3C75_1180480 [compost metagenome]
MLANATPWSAQPGEGAIANHMPEVQAYDFQLKIRFNAHATFMFESHSDHKLVKLTMPERGETARRQGQPPPGEEVFGCRPGLLSQ